MYIFHFPTRLYYVQICSFTTLKLKADFFQTKPKEHHKVSFSQRPLNMVLKPLITRDKIWQSSFNNQNVIFYTKSQKTVKNVFVLSSSNFTNFNNFWHKDGQDDRIMSAALIYHLTYFMSTHYRVKHRCSKL